MLQLVHAQHDGVCVCALFRQSSVWCDTALAPKYHPHIHTNGSISSPFSRSDATAFQFSQTALTARAVCENGNAVASLCENGDDMVHPWTT